MENDADFQKINRTISHPDNPRLTHAWVKYNFEEWYPYLIKGREGTIGFECNPTGEWGDKEKTKKSKLKLSEFLSIRICGSFPDKSTIRCKAKSSSGDARHLADIEFSPELSNLIGKYQKKIDITSPLKHPHFSENEKCIIKNEASEIEVLVQGFEGKEKDAIAKLRVNQDKFRKLLLNYWNGSCAVSGLKDERLLIASHILPWSKSSNYQKGDPFNGLLLSVVWDSLFDKGLVSFDDKGEVILEKLTDEIIEHFELHAKKYCIVPKKLTLEHRQYLQMHRILHGYE